MHTDLSTLHNTQPTQFWLWLIAALAALGFVFANGLGNMFMVWQHKEEYSHGPLLPLISMFLIWQKKNEIAKEALPGTWWGLGIFALGYCGYLVGELSTLYPIMQYSLIICAAGLVLSFAGAKSFRYFSIPLLIFLSSIPLPNFIYKSLSLDLQLLSSQIGVLIIRAFNIPVHLEGNVIDLGALQLQVVEACSGLRYLFPLMTIGFIAANFFKGKTWQKWLIFLSTIPITLLMNSLRIGMIGVTVEWWGAAMAEGFLHDFEGWIVFMGCTGILIVEMWLLAKMLVPKQQLIDVLAVELPEKLPSDHASRHIRRLQKPFAAVCLLSILGAMINLILPKPEPAVVERQPLSNFPLLIGGWAGTTDTMGQNYIDELQLSDYAIIDYRNTANETVNFYLAYYDTQSAGQSAHSPKSCIPAGGWQVQVSDTLSVPSIQVEGKALVINRLEVQKGNTHMLVYYFFKQRHRILTNEFLVKWYLLWDSINLHRKDGALIRLTIAVDGTQTPQELDLRAQQFLTEAFAKFPEFVPN